MGPWRAGERAPRRGEQRKTRQAYQPIASTHLPKSRARGGRQAHIPAPGQQTMTTALDRPQPAPPGPALGVREGPRRAARHGIREAGCLNPSEEVAAGVGLSSVSPSELVVQVHPPLESRVTWGPRKRDVVAVPDAENAAGTHHAVHLFQRLDRPRQALEPLLPVAHAKSPA